VFDIAVPQRNLSASGRPSLEHAHRRFFQRRPSTRRAARRKPVAGRSET